MMTALMKNKAAILEEKKKKGSNGDKYAVSHPPSMFEKFKAELEKPVIRMNIISAS
jgi:ribosomal protein S25